ncbi:CG16704, partial [Drosophila busckii]
CGEKFGLIGGADGTGRTCYALHRMFSYNAEKNECILFFYGGCNGNRNIFASKKKCEEYCVE